MQHLCALFKTAHHMYVFLGEFLCKQTVDNRLRMLSADENAKLIVKKTCLDGVTVAIAQEEWSVRFE